MTAHRQLDLVATVQVVMATCFSATAVLPALRAAAPTQLNPAECHRSMFARESGGVPG